MVRPFAKLCFFLLLLPLQFVSVHGQPGVVKKWVEATPPGADEITGAVSVANRLLLGSGSNGVFSSTDNGQSWQSINAGLTDFRIRAIAGDDTMVIVWTEAAGIYRLSTDGQSWQPVNTGLPQARISGIVVSAGTAFVSFDPVGLSFGSIYRSTNRGATWTKLSSPIGEPTAPMCAHAGVFYCLMKKPVGSSGLIGLMKSTDAGGNFTGRLVENQVWFGFINGMTASEEWLLIGGKHGVWRSPTATLAEPQLSEFPSSNFDYTYSLTELGGRFIVTSAYEQFASTNDGKSWAPAGLFGQPVQVLASTPNSSILAGTRQGRVFINENPFSDAVALSAASYKPIHSPSSIVAIFGDALAASTEVAGTKPLPTGLAGSSIQIQDSAGAPTQAGLFFVSPNQINAWIPDGVAAGEATYSIATPGGITRSGFLDLGVVAPAIFTANDDGQGVPSAYILRIAQNGQLTYIPSFQFDTSQHKYIPAQVKLSPTTDAFFVVLFGTGWRNRSSLSAVVAMIGGTRLVVEYAGPSPDYVGLDQMNIRLPKPSTYNGTYTLSLTVDGKVANGVTIRLAP
jgi:uncharacterized protein (TIGR03437 family)